MSGSKRFVLYVKAGRDGISFGDCPFSHRAYNMYATLKMSGQFQLVMIDTTNKPDSFLQINPDGKVPLLVDKEKDNKIITDSGDITAYIDHEFPEPDLQQSYGGPGVAAMSGIFGKFAYFFKNKDDSLEQRAKLDLINELKKLDDFLSSPDNKGRFMLSDTFCEIDCTILPKLRHVQVAGSMKDFFIPKEFSALRGYIGRGESYDVFKSTCPPDAEIQHGWGRHL